jgi:hypothetical protein
VDETAEVRWVPVDETPAMIARGEVLGAIMLRRQYLLVSRFACMANVPFGHDWQVHTNRSTRTMIRTGRPPAAPSATAREYPPCTRADTEPQAGQDPEEAVHDMVITTASPVSSTRCTLSPRQLREQQGQQLLALLRHVHDAGGRIRTGRRHDTLTRQRGSREAKQGSWRIPASYRSLVARSRRHASTSPNRHNPGDPASLTSRNLTGVTHSQRPQNSRKSLISPALWPLKVDGHQPGANWPHTWIFSWPLARHERAGLDRGAGGWSEAASCAG